MTEPVEIAKMNHGGLSAQRCFNHADREAAARCPACGRCFCRECVTEHDNRMFCANCLSREARLARSGKGMPWLAGSLLAAIGLTVAVAFFYVLGYLLLLIPTDYHGT